MIKYSMKNKGFTLIELLITIAIISILAGGALTVYTGVTTKATRSEAYANLQSIRLLEEQVYSDTGNYTPAGFQSYQATDPAAGGTLEDLLPRFRPGGCVNCGAPYGLSYQYVIRGNFALNAPGIPFLPGQVQAQTPCFIASAIGVPGTRSEGDSFAIDCNNVRNF